MDKFIKKGQGMEGIGGLDVTGLPPGHGPSDFGINRVSGDPSQGPDKKNEKKDIKLTAEEAEQLGRILKAALKAVDAGIGIGMKRDMATSHGGAVDTFFGKLYQGISMVLYPGSAPRDLERWIRNKSAFKMNNVRINQGSKDAFQEHVIQRSRSLYNSNFSGFMDIVKKSKKFKDMTVNDTSELQALAIEYKAADVAIRTTSDESPYKIILKRLIPRLRDKFDAIATFKETAGEGSDIDYEGISESFASGTETADDIGQLEGLYKAIDEWMMFWAALSVSGSVRDSKTGEKEEGEKEEGEKGKQSKALNTVLKGLEIIGIRGGSGVSINPASGGLIVDRRGLDPNYPPVINLILGGKTVEYVNTVGKAKDYFDHFVHTNRIKLMASDVLSNSEYYSDLGTDTIQGGAELTIFLNPTLISKAVGTSPDHVTIMTILTRKGERSVIADDKSMLDDLVKLSGATTTTPLYETVSPSGEAVAFTPADLVLGGGSLTDSKGNKFKYKKRKGKSLSDRVTSSEFGKVKRGLKKKR